MSHADTFTTASATPVEVPPTASTPSNSAAAAPPAEKTYAPPANNKATTSGVLPLTPSPLPGEGAVADKLFVPSIRPAVTPGILPTPSHLPGKVHIADKPYVPSIRGRESADNTKDEAKDGEHGISPPARGKGDTASSYFA